MNNQSPCHIDTKMRMLCLLRQEELPISRLIAKTGTQWNDVKPTLDEFLRLGLVSTFPKGQNSAARMVRNGRIRNGLPVRKLCMYYRLTDRGIVVIQAYRDFMEQYEGIKK